MNALFEDTITPARSLSPAHEQIGPDNNPVMECLRLISMCSGPMPPIAILERAGLTGFTLYVDDEKQLRVKKRLDGETLNNDMRAGIAECKDALIAMLALHPTIPMPDELLQYPYDAMVWAGKAPERPCFSCGLQNWQPYYNGSYWLYGCATCHPEIEASQGRNYYA